MSNILITGAGSFIGRNFIRYSRFKTVEEISLLDRNYASTEFGRYEVILHLAAIVHESRRIGEDEYFRVNRDLCIEVAEKAKQAGVKQFVFLSTIRVYGEYGNRSESWDESSECNPVDLYGKSKLEAEIALKKLESPGFVVSIIRTPVVYGAGVKANILSLIKLVERFPVLPFADIKNLRNYTFAENLVAYIDRIIERRASGTFIVMDDTPLSTSELVVQITDGLDKKRVIFKLPDWIINMGKFFMPHYFDRIYGSLLLDNRMTKNSLDFTPPYSIEAGLKKMMDSYKSGFISTQTR